MPLRLMRISLLKLSLLALLWAGAQTLLAWHAPSHIEDAGTLSHLSADQDCTLGVNGHGVALVGNLSLSLSGATVFTQPLYHSPAPPPVRARIARARAPPALV
jgi:hypothetical protein